MEPMEIDEKEDIELAKPNLLQLAVTGRFVGFKRNKVKQRPHIALIKINGVHSKKETNWYLGKYILFTYGIKNKKFKLKFGDEEILAIKGVVKKAHGGNGVVQAKFDTNLPSGAMGCEVHVLLFPQDN